MLLLATGNATKAISASSVSVVDLKASAQRHFNFHKNEIIKERCLKLRWRRSAAVALANMKGG
jgi:hypothetical protein